MVAGASPRCRNQASFATRPNLGGSREGVVDLDFDQSVTSVLPAEINLTFDHLPLERASQIWPLGLRHGFCRQPLNFGSGRFGRQSQIVGRLQVEPKLRACLEPVPKPQCGVAGDGPLAMNDLADAVGRHGNLARKLCRADAKFFELIGEDFAGMDGGAGHFDSFPQW